uniref:Ovule protein n=1 Tax=Brugia timori TaxID=42155 RepID=A0A0R3RD01_9BILA
LFFFRRSKFNNSCHIRALLLKNFPYIFSFLRDIQSTSQNLSY